MLTPSIARPRTTNNRTLNTPVDIIRPLTVRPISPEIASPQRPPSITSQYVTSPGNTISSPQIVTPRPLTTQTTVPQSIAINALSSSPREIEHNSVTYHTTVQNSATLRSAGQQNNALPPTTQRHPTSNISPPLSHRVNPLSPVHDEPVTIDGRPFDPTILSPIMRIPSISRATHVNTPPMSVIVPSVRAPQVGTTSALLQARANMEALDGTSGPFNASASISRMSGQHNSILPSSIGTQHNAHAQNSIPTQNNAHAQRNVPTLSGMNSTLPPLNNATVHNPQPNVETTETNNAVKKKTARKTKKKVSFPSWEQIVKNYQTPDYNLLPVEQQRLIRNDFIYKFNIIKQYLPGWSIKNVAEDESISLAEVHAHYGKLLDQISTNSNADWYKCMLVLCWLGAEYVVTQYLGLKSGGYAFFQSRNMSKYNHLLMQLGEVDRTKGFSSWSPMAQLVAGSSINLVIFVIVHTFLGNMSEEHRYSICNMVGSYFTSSEANKPAGLAGIPGLLSGNPQDNPEGIASVGSGLINDGSTSNLLGGIFNMFTGNRNTAPPANNGPGRRRNIED